MGLVFRGLPVSMALAAEPCQPAQQSHFRPYAAFFIVTALFGGLRRV